MKKVVIAVLLFSVLSLSLVSAGFFSDFFGKATGKATSDVQQLQTSSVDACLTDFNSDGVVNDADYAMFTAEFNKPVASNNSQYDLNKEGEFIDFSDYVLFAQNYGKTCSTSSAVTCIDSDGGKEYYIKGTMDSVFSDYCMTGSSTGMLVEYTCVNSSGNPSGTGITNETYYYSCPYGCSDGACLAVSAPTGIDYNAECAAVNFRSVSVDGLGNGTAYVQFDRGAEGNLSVRLRLNFSNASGISGVIDYPYSISPLNTYAGYISRVVMNANWLDVTPYFVTQTGAEFICPQVFSYNLGNIGESLGARYTLGLGQSMNISVNGRSYNVSLIYTDPNSAQFTINGEATAYLRAGSSYDAGNVIISVRSIIGNEVFFSLNGSEEIEETETSGENETLPDEFYDIMIAKDIGVWKFVEGEVRYDVSDDGFSLDSYIAEYFSQSNDFEYGGDYAAVALVYDFRNRAELNSFISEVWAEETDVWFIDNSDDGAFLVSTAGEPFIVWTNKNRLVGLVIEEVPDSLYSDYLTWDNNEKLEIFEIFEDILFEYVEKYSSDLNPSDFEEKNIPLVCENSCTLENQCVSIGYRTNTAFCDLGYTFTEQKLEGTQCLNHFECDSNVCVSGECVSGNLIQKILNWFRDFFGS